MDSFETHLVYPAAVFTYEDGRAPWFVLPHIRGSSVRCFAKIDDERCLLLGSQNDVLIVDVARQRILEKGAFPASTFYIPSLALSSDRKRVVIYSGGLNGIALVEIDPLNVTFLGRMTRTESSCRFLKPGEAAPDGWRTNSFHNACFRRDGQIILTPYAGPYYEEGVKHNSSFLVLDPSTLEVSHHAFDCRFDFPLKGWFSPSGHWLLAIRQSGVEFVEHASPGPLARPFGMCPREPTHPDLAADGKRRWGLLLEQWDMEAWKISKVFACRFYEERELAGGWLLDFPSGDKDVIWQFANWFLITHDPQPCFRLANR